MLFEQAYIFFTIFFGGVCIINNTGLFTLKTCFKYDAFSMSSFQHVKINTYVGAEKILQIKSGFSAGLWADKNYSIHIDYSSYC